MKKLITLILTIAMVITIMVPAVNVSANMKVATDPKSSSPKYFKGIRVNDNASYSTILNDGVYFSALEHATATDTYVDSAGNSTDNVNNLYETLAEGEYITFEFSSSSSINAIHLWLRGINKIKTYKVEVSDGQGGWSLAKEGSFYRELTASEEEELQDRSYAHTITFNDNKTQNSSVTLRFTPTELADGVDNVQIAEAYVGYEGIKLNYYSDGTLIYGNNGSISSGKGVGETSTYVTKLSENVGSPGSGLRKTGKSPYFYDYKASGDDKDYGENGITHKVPGSLWPYSPSDTTAANIISDENGCWYMADLDLSGQPVNFISTTVAKGSAAVTSYEILISNDKAAWNEGPTSEKWISVKKSTCNFAPTASAVANLMCTVPDAPNARFWLIRVYGQDNANIKLGLTKLYYADRAQRETHSSASETIAWAASDAFKKLAAEKVLPATVSTKDGMDSKTYTYNLTWKIDGNAVNAGEAINFDTTAKDVELEITGYGGVALSKASTITQNHTRCDFIPSLSAELDGTKEAGSPLKYKAVANDVDENTKVFFALYTNSDASELVSVTSSELTASGLAYTASYTVPGNYADGMTVKAFLWDGTTLTPLTTNVPTR